MPVVRITRKCGTQAAIRPLLNAGARFVPYGRNRWHCPPRGRVPYAADLLGLFGATPPVGEPP